MACNFISRIRSIVDRSPIVRFAIIGGIATVIHYGVYYLLLWTGVYYTLSYILGYAISLVFNFFATGRFTFRTTLNSRKGALFLMSHAVNFVLHVSLLEFFVRAVGVSDKIAPIFVLCIAVPVNYLLVRYAMKDKNPKRHE